MRLNGLEFHVESEGAGPALLVLHGFTGSVRAWDDLRAELTSSARVIAIDLIGHGRSAIPVDVARYTLDWAAADLEALLDALGLERVDLLGYSMGGRLALHFALRAPQRLRRLILESASAGIDNPADRQQRARSDDALASRILVDGVAAFVAEWEQVPLLLPAAHVSAQARAAQHAQRLSNDPLGLANSLRGMGAGQQDPLWARLPELDLPVYVIVGERDARYQAIGQRMSTLLPRARLDVVPQAGHTVHLDQPRAFAALVRWALAEIPSRL
ncbi:MAG TPA: 2-succinyl-6-hydroxy-2,4-cyclohexadiene-1-carboxylate synthase [Chloroflexota bacterium]